MDPIILIFLGFDLLMLSINMAKLIFDGEPADLLISMVWAVAAGVTLYIGLS